MNKLAFAPLGFLALVCAAGTTQAGAGEADLSLDPGQLFFTYHAPSGDLADLPMTPNTSHNPLILPCDVQLFGGELDVDYLGRGPSVFPLVTISFFDKGGAVITGNGCTTNTFTSLPMDLAAMQAGTVQTAGYTPVAAAPAMFCDWQYQPDNLPTNQPVRMHLAVSGMADAAYSQPVGDPDPSNNAVDVWVKRECGCN